MRRIIPIIGCLLAGCLVIGAQTKSEQFDLNFVFREPLLSGIAPRNPVWSPNDSLLVFEWNDQGYTLYDLWLADASTGKSERLTDFAQRNEQVNFEQLTWLGDSRQIAFIMQGDVYIMRLTPQRQLRRLTRTPVMERNLCLSPDRQRLAYLRENELIIYDLPSGQERAFVLNSGPISPEMEPGGLIRWSPSGKQVAVILPTDWSTQFPLTIVDLSSNCLKSLEFTTPVAMPGVVWDFCWAPDEKRIGLEITAADMTARYLTIVDFTRSRLDTVYQEKAPGLNLSPNQPVLYWFSDGEQLLFASEQNGYRHLYLLNLTTRRAEALTRGKWQVEECQIDESRKVIYFIGNRDNFQTLGLYALNLSDFQITPVSYLDGHHRIRLAPQGTKIAELFSNAVNPPDLYWIETKPKYRMHRLTVAPNPLFKEYKLGQVVGKSTRNPESGVDINYRLWLPAQNLAGQKYPLIIVLNAENALRPTYNRWQQTNLWEQWLSSQGMVVAEVEYTNLTQARRLVQSGQSPDILAVQISDIKAVLETEGQRDYVDINRVGVVGWGYGGYLAAQVLMREGRYFRGGAALAGLWPESEADYTAVNTYFRALRMWPEKFAPYDLLSFTNYLGSRLFLAQGAQSCLPELLDGAALGRQLLDQNKKVDFRCYPWMGTIFDSDETLADVFEKLSTFLVNNL